MPEPAAIEETAILGGRLRLMQPVKGHRAGTDAVLLAACVENPSGLIIDLGTGCGAVGLALAQRGPHAKIVLADDDPAILALARRNITLNALDDRAIAVEADIYRPASRRAAGLLDGAADLVVTNPPFLTLGTGRASPDAARARAHVMAGSDGLALWIRAASALLRPGGRLVLIHRADALGEVIAVSAGRLGALAILPVFPRAGDAAVRILVSGIKGSRAPLQIRAGLILHGPDGKFTGEAEMIHRGERQLAM